MDTPDIIALAFFLAGIMDFIVMPRILLHVWKKSGQENPSQGLIIRLLRLSGLLLVVAGVLFHYRIIRI